MRLSPPGANGDIKAAFREHSKNGRLMVSRTLIAITALQVLLLLLLMVFLVGNGALTGAVALSACTAFVFLNACGVAAGYVFVRGYAAARCPPRRGASRPSWRCSAKEVLALFAVFFVFQPFERWWMGRERVPSVAPGHAPLLLVHGYMCNRGLWWWMRREFRKRRLAVATVNLEPPRAGIDQLAARLDERIEELVQATGRTRVVLLTHSMGGLISLAYLRKYGAARVAKLVMLAAPMHGTHVARLGIGANAREMRPDSAWLRALTLRPVPIPIVSIWTRDDEILAPAETSRIDGAQDIVLDGLGHMAMVFSPRVLACLEDELALGSYS